LPASVVTAGPFDVVAAGKYVTPYRVRVNNSTTVPVSAKRGTGTPKFAAVLTELRGASVRLTLAVACPAFACGGATTTTPKMTFWMVVGASAVLTHSHTALPTLPANPISIIGTLVALVLIPLPSGTVVGGCPLPPVPPPVPSMMMTAFIFGLFGSS